MRNMLPRQKDNTVNKRMQRRVQRVRDNGGKPLSILMDAKTNQSLQFLMKNTDETQRSLLSKLIQETAKQAGFKYEDKTR